MIHVRLSGVLAVAALGLLLVPSAVAQVKKDVPNIAFVPANSNPPLPAGLKVTCLTGPNVLVPNKTCPVVKYQGITTWAYSFLDNRVSMALVSYDAQNRVVGNVTHDGARYVWNMISSLPNKTVMFVGQANQSFTVNWANLGAR